MKKTEYIRHLQIGDREFAIFDINLLAEKGVADIKRLPFSIKILVENLLRKSDGKVVKEKDLLNIARWQKVYDSPLEIPYHPARVLMQDFTGVPAVVDLAAMRDAVKELGKDPNLINPLVPVELIVDHSIQVDYFGTVDALTKNVAKEYQRNAERYALLKWAQKSFDNFKVVPPNSGICHQVNLEYLGRVIITEKIDDLNVAYPDTLVGLDSHTTMINAIGVMGWGVGGIEAEAVMLGQPYYMSIPQVVGVKMVGELKEGVTATDLVLRVTEMLRQHDVVEKFVEFFGPGMKLLTIPDRATIANMSPEYGATMGFFPVDEKTIEYLRLTNRQAITDTVETCSKALGLFYTGEEDPEYSQVLALDLATIEPSVAGPTRPQDRISLTHLKQQFLKSIDGEYDRDERVAHTATIHEESDGETTRASVSRPRDRRIFDVRLNDKDVKIGDGSIVIAAITSCTNTSNPSVLLGAGLLAKQAVEKGLDVPGHVKTSLAPGSKVVVDYLEHAGLMPYLKALGFHLAAFGCTTCIGNSGPLHPAVEAVISKNDLNVAAVLSGNRNFEARIHQRIKSNFLTSPMLVVAFAIAGRIDIDFTTEPISVDPNGNAVFLADLWPSNGDIESFIQKHVKSEFFAKQYDKIFDGDEFWHKLPETGSTTFEWDSESTYVKRPPFFENFELDLAKPIDISDSKALLLLGDSVTTDHISPAGAIPEEYPAGEYLISKNVAPEDFNSYGSRRGNHEVMMRGTFGNIRIKNLMVSPKEGSFTVKPPQTKETYIYEAAMAYRREGTALVVLAGKEYGTGSSRDWAAKGTNLLGVSVVIAESYERIHRSNLVGMGVLPLMFKPGEGIDSFGLKGTETFFISGVENIKPRGTVKVKAIRPDGGEIDFETTARLDTEVDVDYFEHGGILPYVLRKLTSNGKP